MISFTIYGEPIASQRPRFTVRKGFAFAYTAKKMKIGLADFRTQSLQFKPETPLEGPLSIKIKIFRKIPSSLSKKKRAMALDCLLRPKQRPDVDNYGKFVLDALNQVYFRDDAQFVDMQISKFYGEQPRTEVEIEPIEDNSSLDAIALCKECHNKLNKEEK